ncbi:MAG TPA: undecaprenyl-diphosphate phosphatase [Myxococcota bacterium]|nr:undecaprenyl-diphosphate phosphatase [Myxococcota bacterium]
MWLVALLLGVVEGLTEFLPISSTGHLILTSELLDFHGKRAEAFEIFIQGGAILAVLVEYRARFTQLAQGLPRSPEARAFAVRLALAFLPAAAIGFLAHDFISDRLFSPRTVAFALIGGALLILLVERMPLKVRTTSTDAMTWHQALGIGAAQCLALWPGFSRSAATILGGLGMGLDRRSATEFSFFLAVPTIVAASGYGLLKNASQLEAGDAVWLGVATLVSFAVAWATIRWLLRYVATHDFRVFAYYRLALGVIVLATLH